jgi:thiamine transport system permease protein
MPAIVVVFAVLAVYGRKGWLAEGLAIIGIDVSPRIYGWPGILLAHVFLNTPFVARVYLDALATVPAEHWRLAEMLRFRPIDVARHLDWPVVKSELAGLASLVFLMCFVSFAIVLTLGGGSGRATLEVAIFEALRVDLDFGRAAWLGLVQVVICLTFAGAMHGLIARVPVAHTIRVSVARPDSSNRRLRILDAGVLVIATLLLAPPLASVATGLSALAAILDADLAQALVASIAIAALSALGSCVMAFALASTARHERLALRRPRVAALYGIIPAMAVAVPPLALATGVFLVLRRVVDPALAGYGLLPLINALGALPFTFRFVSPAVAIAGERYTQLADLLGMTGVTRFRIVDWPLLRKPLAAAFAMAAALSFGDFGVIALFGGSELRTLPYLLYERLGAYRLDEAAAIGLVLVMVAFALAYLTSRWSDADR